MGDKWNPVYGPVLVHSDLLGAHYFLGKATRRQPSPEAHMKFLERWHDSNNLWFPTFNYDFTKTGLYDVQRSPSQIGALSEYARSHPGYTRCRNRSGVVDGRLRCDCREL